MAQAVVRIGTRGSPPALWQADEARARLGTAFPELAEPGAVEIVAIHTTADRITDRPLADIGGKGLFTKEIDEALLENRVDLAVHSIKDVPTWLPPGIVMPCVLEREQPWDVLITHGSPSRLADLPPGAVVGTASLRRQAQILNRRPDLKVATFRGNVHTRLAKLVRGEADATVLALAGLKRLGLENVGTVLPAAEMLPAVGQGAIGITCRTGNETTRLRLAAIDHPPSRARVTAERAFLAVLDGSCRTPIAALAEIEGDDLKFRGLAARPDGRDLISVERRGGITEAATLGRDAGIDLRSRAAPGVLPGGSS
jgi:hydroxymethylbilane synthase